MNKYKIKKIYGQSNWYNVYSEQEKWYIRTPKGKWFTRDKYWKFEFDVVASSIEGARVETLKKLMKQEITLDT